MFHVDRRFIIHLSTLWEEVRQEFCKATGTSTYVAWKLSSVLQRKTFLCRFAKRMWAPETVFSQQWFAFIVLCSDRYSLAAFKENVVAEKTISELCGIYKAYQSCEYFAEKLMQRFQLWQHYYSDYLIQILNLRLWAVLFRREKWETNYILKRQTKRHTSIFIIRTVLAGHHFCFMFL